MHNFRLKLTSYQRKTLEKKLVIARNRGNAPAIDRIRVILARSEGKTPQEVSHILRISEQTIITWVNRYLIIGIAFVFYRKKSPGRPSKLTKKNKKELSRIIDKGPAKCDFPKFLGNCWRSPMIQELIRCRFGVCYSVKYISQLLKKLGFSYQKAMFESGKGNDAKRKEWIEIKWPEILKLAKEKDACILFEDEVSFAQWGSVTYTWAKIGKKLKIKTSGIRKGYKVFGAIDYFTGDFYYKCLEERFNSVTYESYLSEVLSQTEQHIILIHDGAPYHNSKAIKQFFEANKTRLSVYRLPSYTPEYNPIEKLWKKVKEKGTHLHYFPTFDSLKEKVHDSLAFFKNDKQEVLALFIKYNNLAESL